MMAKPEHIERLASGLTLIHRHMPDTDSVTVQISFGAGGRYEDLSTEYGVSHFLEHLLFKGSQKYPSAKIISEKIDGVGGYMNAYTTEEMTSYYIKVPQQHFELALDVLADMTLHPLFDATEIDRERSVILEEMNVYLDDPGQHVFDLVGGLLWPEDPLRTNVIGTAEIVRQLPREVIAGYHAALYTLDNAIVSVAGNVPLHFTEKNSRIICELAGKTATRVYAGCDRPMKRALVTAEYVHGQTGLNGPQLADPTMPLQPEHGVDFIIEGNCALT